MLKGILITLCFLVGTNLYADEQESIIDFSQFVIWFEDTNNLMDYTVKEELVSSCAKDYIKQQSKSYTKIVQDNLYDLIHNFERITSKIYGKAGKTDNIPYSEKVETLAKVQCELYFNMGMLK